MHVDEGLLRLFEFYLLALQDESVTQVLARIHHELTSQLQQPALNQARELLQRYIDYRLALQGLPALAEDRVYQLWLVRPDGNRDTGALFRSSGDILVTAPQAFSSYVRFGVTVEPAGGSPSPTGPGALGL